MSPQEVYGTTEEPRETPYEAPAGEDVIWEAEQAYDWESGETGEEPPLRYQYEAQAPDDSALIAERIAFAAMLTARQAGADSVRALREAVGTQAARWLPSAAGAITRLNVPSALDSLFS